MPIDFIFDMQEQQLQEFRGDKWRVNGKPVRTLEDARAFVESVGFCLLYPQRPTVTLPTFIGAYAGSDENLPTPQMAFADNRASEAKALMVRLLREKAAYEANVFPENNFIVSASVFPYFYGLMGDRNPRQAPKAGARSGYSPLAVHAFEGIQAKGPISKSRLRELLGKEISEAALDRALDELWAKLRITRVDYNQDEGVFWDVLFRWAPEAVKEGAQISVAESITALVSKYLDCVLAAQQEDMEDFFSHFVGRARVRDAVHALQAARELNFVHVGGRVMLQVSSLEAAYVQKENTDANDDQALPAKRSFRPQPLRPGKPLVQRRPRPAPDKTNSVMKTSSFPEKSGLVPPSPASGKKNGE